MLPIQSCFAQKHQSNPTDKPLIQAVRCRVENGRPLIWNQGISEHPIGQVYH